MSDLKRLISREIRAQSIQRRIRGKILSSPTARFFDTAGAQDLVFVCDVDIGADRPLRNVPVKINGPKARFYAEVGSPVYLDTDAQGRYQVVAPADRGPEQGTLQVLDEDAETYAGAGNVGLTLVRQPYTYYAGITPESFFDPSQDPDTLLWLRSWDRLYGAPANILPVSDNDNVEVVSIDGKAPTSIGGIRTFGSPGYRRFDPNNPNGLSSVQFSGFTGFDLTSNVIETTAGQISIFLLCRNEAPGTIARVLLELRNWRLYSQQAGSDTWGFANGVTIHDSARTIGTTFTLIELVAASFGSVTLYQDGGLVGVFNPAGSGLLLPDSSFGYSASGAGSTHNGRVLEVLVLDRTVTGTDRVLIESYFDRLVNVAYSRWNDGLTGYPAITVLDAQGNPI